MAGKKEFGLDDDIIGGLSQKNETDDLDSLFDEISSLEVDAPDTNFLIDDNDEIPSFSFDEDESLDDVLSDLKSDIVNQEEVSEPADKAKPEANIEEDFDIVDEGIVDELIEENEIIEDEIENEIISQPENDFSLNSAIEEVEVEAGADIDSLETENFSVEPLEIEEKRQEPLEITTNYEEPLEIEASLEKLNENENNSLEAQEMESFDSEDSDTDPQYDEVVEVENFVPQNSDENIRSSDNHFSGGVGLAAVSDQQAVVVDEEPISSNKPADLGEKLRLNLEWYSGKINEKTYELYVDNMPEFLDKDKDIKTIHINVSSGYGWNVFFDNGVFMNIEDLKEYQERHGSIPAQSGKIIYGNKTTAFDGIEKIVVYKKARYFSYQVR